MTAESEEEAVSLFFDELALSNESIENYITAKQVKPRNKKAVRL